MSDVGEALCTVHIVYASVHCIYVSRAVRRPSSPWPCAAEGVARRAYVEPPRVCAREPNAASVARAAQRGSRRCYRSDAAVRRRRIGSRSGLASHRDYP
jgi:hypothetical protein